MRSGAAPAKAKYLFAERGSPYEITLMLPDRLKKELTAIPQEVLLNTSAEVLTDEIVQRYRLNVPVLDRNGSGEFEPVGNQITSSAEQPIRILRRTRPLLRGRDAVQNPSSLHR